MLPPTTISMASVGKIQLLAALDNEVRELGLTVDPADIFLLYTDSDGGGAGKVYGGCAGHKPNTAPVGQKPNSQWYVLFAYGPIGAAKIGAKAGVVVCGGPVTARNILEQKRQEKAGRTGHYRASWPGDRLGLAVNRCRCGTAYASGGYCHVCQPREAKAAAAIDTRYPDSPARRLTASRSAQLPPVVTPPSAAPANSDAGAATLDHFGTDKVRW